MDAINPQHYKTPEGRQAYEIMIEKFGIEKFLAFCELNAFKYRFRMGNKEGQPMEQDQRKALWYENKAKELTQKEKKFEILSYVNTAVMAKQYSNTIIYAKNKHEALTTFKNMVDMSKVIITGIYHDRLK